MNEPSDRAQPDTRPHDERGEQPLPDSTSPTSYDDADPAGRPSLEKAAPADPTPTDPNLGAQVPPPWQPPTGQQPWGATPPPAGQPYPGQPNPQWQQQWQPQRAIRPGVIPLRPLGLSEILDGAISFIRSHPVAAIGLSAVVAAIAQVIDLVVTLSTGLGTPPDPADLERDPERYLDQVGSLFGSTAITAVIQLIAVAVLTGTLIVVLSQAVLGRKMPIGEAWRTAKGRLPGLIGITFLSTLGVAATMAIGFLPALAALALGSGGAAVAVLMFLGLLGGVGAAIYLWVSWSLIGPVYVLEHAGVIDSFRRSRRLVQAQWWRIFGTLLLAGFIAGIIAFIIAVPFTGIGAAVSGVAFTSPAAFTPVGLVIVALGGIVASTLTWPFQAGVTGLLYFDQRMRREGLDITLQRAAQQ